MTNTPADKIWSKAESDRAVELRTRDGLSYAEIGRQLGRTANAVCSRLAKTLGDRARIAMRFLDPPWSQQEYDRAIHLRTRIGLSYQDVANVMGRSKHSVRNKLIRIVEADTAGIEKLKPHSAGTPARRITEQQEAERERLRAARELRDTTGVLCGDPPIGYSALDQRTTGETSST